MFAKEVAANFAVPCVVAVYAVPLIVDEAVSMLLAVKYVPEYTVYGCVSFGFGSGVNLIIQISRRMASRRSSYVVVEAVSSMTHECSRPVVEAPMHSR
jgi:hypothetical protein